MEDGDNAEDMSEDDQLKGELKSADNGAISDQDQSNGDGPKQGEVTVVDDGPGCMPAILAAAALMGIAGFVFCGFSTWLLYQKRTELATRTLRDAYLPEIEQSLLDPETKSAVMDQIELLAKDMERGKIENWQSAGVLQRLQRLPVLQWGDMQAVESYVVKNGSSEEATNAHLQFARLSTGVQNGKVTSFDFHDILAPVQNEDPTVASGRKLRSNFKLDPALDVVTRARVVADREKISDELIEVDGVRLEKIVAKEIESGLVEGSY